MDTVQWTQINHTASKQTMPPRSKLIKITEMSTKVDAHKIKEYQIIMMGKAMESLVKKKKAIQISHQNLIKMIDQETTLHSIQKV